MHAAAQPIEDADNEMNALSHSVLRQAWIQRRERTLTSLGAMRTLRLTSMTTTTHEGQSVCSRLTRGMHD
jgi:hypothetical protein